MYDIYGNFKCSGNIIHIENNNNNIMVDKVIDGSDEFINGKIVDDFNILDRDYIYTLNVSATQQLHRIIMEQKNETNDLKTRLARLEAIPSTINCL